MEQQRDAKIKKNRTTKLLQFKQKLKFKLNSDCVSLKMDNILKLRRYGSLFIIRVGGNGFYRDLERCSEAVLKIINLKIGLISQ